MTAEKLPSQWTPVKDTDAESIHAWPGTVLTFWIMYEGQMYEHKYTIPALP